MTFGEAIEACVGKYFSLTGRASRSEFWWFFLFCVIATPVSLLVAQVIPLAYIISLAILPPYLAVAGRRFQDIGWDGKIAIVLAILGMGGGYHPAFMFFSFAYVVLCCLPGTSGPNQYGPDPLAPVEGKGEERRFALADDSEAGPRE